MLSFQLAALQVVIPLLAAPVTVIFRNPRLSWYIAALTGVACSFTSIGVLQQVLANGMIVYSLGGWAAPWGIEYRIDSANAFVLLIISIIYLASILYAPKSIDSEVPEERRSWLYTAWILCFLGLAGITISGDVFNVFVFLEISSLSTYILTSFGPDRRCLVAAMRYLIMGTIAATFFLIGIGLLYALTGTLNMADLAGRIPTLTGNRTAYTAFGFIVAGLAIKVAMFPFHNWLPSAYAYAPNAVTAFLAGTATKAAVYVFIRIVFTIFPTSYFLDGVAVSTVVMIVGILGIGIGSTIAIYQSNLKKLFAWSSVGQIGYIVIGVGLATSAGLAASFLHLFNHALMKTALFMAIGGLAFVTGSTSVNSLEGAGRRMPWTMAAIVLGGLSLIGVPLTTGFISKWYLISAAIQSELWWLVIAVLAGSMITAIYVWKLVELAYFRKPAAAAEVRQEAPLSLLIPTWLMIAANIYFGINASFTGGRALDAAVAVLSTWQ